MENIHGDIAVKGRLEALGGTQANTYIVNALLDFTTAEPVMVAGEMYINSTAGLGFITTADTFNAGSMYLALSTGRWQEIVPATGWLAYNSDLLKLQRFDGIEWADSGLYNILNDTIGLYHLEPGTPGAVIGFDTLGNPAELNIAGFTKPFLIADWSAIVAGDQTQTISVPVLDHGVGASVLVQVYEGDDTFGYEPIQMNKVTVDVNGNVTIETSAGDTFDGKAVIK